MSPYPRNVEQTMRIFYQSLRENDRRRYAAVEAIKLGHGGIEYISKSAEKVPEDLYSFQATPKVRTFGQIIGHIADANQNICAAATSGTPAKESAEKTKTSKADLQKALAEGFAACDAAFAAMTDAKAAEMTKFFGGDQPRLAVLSFNTAHDFEHYGNLVTYMRLKGLTPPSSAK